MHSPSAYSHEGHAQRRASRREPHPTHVQCIIQGRVCTAPCTIGPCTVRPSRSMHHAAASGVSAAGAPPRLLSRLGAATPHSERGPVCSGCAWACVDTAWACVQWLCVGLCRHGVGLCAVAVRGPVSTRRGPVCSGCAWACVDTAWACVQWLCVGLCRHSVGLCGVAVRHRPSRERGPVYSERGVGLWRGPVWSRCVNRVPPLHTAHPSRAASQVSELASAAAQ
jgi:hypothetical protein